VKKNPKIEKKITRRRDDALLFQKKITVMMLEVIGSLIGFLSFLVGGEGVFILVEE